MNEQRFTPGPWTFSRWNEFGDMRFYIAQADGAPHTPQYSDVATLIAETTHGEWQSIQEANAHLIAAAPCLLAACQAFIKYDEAPDTEETGLAFMELYADALAKARAAIARALHQVGEKQ